MVTATKESNISKSEVSDNNIEEIVQLADSYRSDVKVLLEDSNRLDILQQIQFFAIMAQMIENGLRLADKTIVEGFIDSFSDFKSEIQSHKSLEGLEILLQNAQLALINLFSFDKANYGELCDYMATQVYRWHKAWEFA